MIKSQEEFDAMKRKVEAMGYTEATPDMMFTPLFKQAISEITELVERRLGGELAAEVIMVGRLENLENHLADTYPGIAASEVAVLLAAALSNVMATLMFVGQGNQLGAREN